MDRKPIVGVDARTFYDVYSVARGIGHYAFHHLQALARTCQDWRFILYGFGEEPYESLSGLLALPNVRYRNMDAYKPEDVELFHIPDPMNCTPGFESPMQLFRHNRLTVSFHDLTPLHYYLRSLPPSLRNEYLSRLAHLLQGNGVLLTNSAYTRQDLIASINFPPDRAHTILAGINRSEEGSLANGQERQQILEGLGVNKPYFLHVGALDPHKNFETVIHCFRLCRKWRPIQLVLVGKLTPGWRHQVEQLAREEGDIIISGFVPRKHLDILYREAVALLFLSRAEGFGFPILEAMLNGCPVIATNVTSIPEITNDAALLFAPDDVERITQGMRSLIDNPVEREIIIRKGLSQASKFSWERTAKKTIAVWEPMLRQTLSPAMHPESIAVRECVTPSSKMDHNDSAKDDIRSSEPTKAAGIKWGSHILDFHGHAAHSRLCLAALEKRKIPLAVEPFGLNEQFAAQLDADELKRWRRLMKQKVERGVYICFAVPTTLDEGIDVFSFYRQRNPGFDAYVGIATFETDRLPPGWAEVCNGMDEIWVPSAFNRETFSHSGVKKPIHVFPTGIDTRNFDPDRVLPLDITGRSGFAFLSVFQWTKRKGWDVLLKAYFSAFTQADDVCMVLRTYPYRFKNPPVRERIAFHAKQWGYREESLPRLILLDEQIPEKSMPRLYAAADAFVLPTRGEGFGIPFMEAMAMGLPVIGTRWSGHLDFMNDENSYLIDVEGLAPVGPEQTAVSSFYTKDHRWAEPSVEHTAALMRHVYEHRKEAKEKGRKARRDIREQWNPDRTADWIAERASSLLQSKSQIQSDALSPITLSVDSESHRDTESNRPLILWNASIFDPSGYADEARHMVERIAPKWPIRLEPVGRSSESFAGGMDQSQRDFFSRLTQTTFKPPFIRIIQAPAMAFRRDLHACYNIGRTVFETDSLPTEWVERCNEMDEIWVPTEFNIETFRNAGVKTSLEVVPQGVDSRFYHPHAAPLRINGKRSFAFLSIFEWVYRKGWDLLLRAWADAFTSYEDVCLILRTYPINCIDGPDAQMEIEQRIGHFLRVELGRSTSDVAPIIVLGRQVPQQNMPGLYAAADAFVLPSRGEGWGRPYIEAMACGLPVIGTRWGGNLSFMNDENSYLIDVDGLTEVGDQMEFPFYKGHRWSAPSLDHLKRLMRQVFEDRKSSGQKGMRARQDTVTHWAWEKVATTILDRLETLKPPRSDSPRTKLGGSPRQLASVTSRQEFPIRVIWEGSQFVHHSLALVNREICLQLVERSDTEICLLPFEPDQFNPEPHSHYRKLVDYLFAPLSSPPQVHIRHQWPPNFTAPPHGHWVMIQPWEYGRLPEEWIEPMSSMVDEIWVPSRHVMKTYLASGIPGNRVKVIPNGVNTKVFHPGAKPCPLATTKTFKFLFVGGTIWRKGIDLLLDAYLGAFRREDDVCLIIKDIGQDSFYKGQGAAERIRQIQNDPRSPEILYMTETLAEQDMPGLFTACDCLVHPYRGEGFGLPVLEAMACGLPPIVTAGGATDDFCLPDHSYLIPSRLKPFTSTQIKLVGGIGWVLEPDVAALTEILKHVQKQPKDLEEKRKYGVEHAKAHCTWDQVAAQIVERIRNLMQKPIRRMGCSN